MGAVEHARIVRRYSWGGESDDAAGGATIQRRLGRPSPGYFTTSLFPPALLCVLPAASVA